MILNIVKLDANYSTKQMLSNAKCYIKIWLQTASEEEEYILSCASLKLTRIFRRSISIANICFKVAPNSSLDESFEVYRVMEPYAFE